MLTIKTTRHNALAVATLRPGMANALAMAFDDDTLEAALGGAIGNGLGGRTGAMIGERLAPRVTP